MDERRETAAEWTGPDGTTSGGSARGGTTTPSDDRRSVLRLGGSLLGATLAGCQLLGGSPGDHPGRGRGDGGTPGGAAEGTPSPTSPTPTSTPDGPMVGAKLAPPERDDGARFGTAVDIAGNRAIVGAPRDVLESSAVGSVYVFRQRDGRWAPEATLRADSPVSWDAFGAAVALGGRTAVVGAPGVNYQQGVRSGAAYVFRREADGWVQEQSLRPGDGQGEKFGTDVDLAGETALVGSKPISRIDAPLSGAAYVFERDGSTWRQAAKLSPAGGDRRDIFGSSLSLADGEALVGASRALRRDGARTGAVYAFGGGGDDWGQSDVLHIEGEEAGDAVGESVAHRGGTALVGAPGYAHPSGARAGAIGVFDRRGGDWRYRETLLPVDGEVADRFAHAVAMAPEGGLVGVPRDDNAEGRDAGSVAVLGRADGRWTLDTRVVMASGGADYRFGQAIAVDGGRALVGAPGDVDANGKQVGSAVVVAL